MQDNLLFKKIANSLFETCKENHISIITFFEVDVSFNSQVDKQRLLDHLIDEIPELVNYNTKISINNGDIDTLTAIVKTVEGVFI